MMCYEHFAVFEDHNNSSRHFFTEHPSSSRCMNGSSWPRVVFVYRLLKVFHNKLELKGH